MLRNVTKKMTAKTLYYQSNYQNAAEAKQTLKDLPYVIGGMVFTAQHTEARHLYETRKKELDPDQHIICRFHIGISYTRTSDYEAARIFFQDNLKAARKYKNKLKPVSLFYCYQGAAFYRYYFSLNLKSHIHAQRGYETLLKIKTPQPLLKVLSMDLQGHNLVQLGQVNRGLVFFEKAIKICDDNLLLSLKKEINISRLQYLSAHDDKPELYINQFLKRLKDQTYQNDYSKSNIVLQTTKLYILKGDFDKANSFLKDHYDTIYRKQDKRKVAVLNTLLAQLMMYRGQFLESISVLQSALNFLSPEVDKVLMLPLLGLQLKATINLGKDDVELRKKISVLNSKVNHLVSKKIQNR